MRRIGWTLALLAASGCSSTPEARRARPAPSDELDVARLLLEYGAEQAPATLAEPEATVEELEASLDMAEGERRQEVLRSLAFNHLFESEWLEGDEREDHQRKARRYARLARAGVDAPYRLAELAFIDLWVAWRSDRRSADRIASRFVERHGEHGGALVTLGWFIRGEVLYADERWEEAAEAYRYLLGHLEDPLYGLALFRTAYTLGNRGRNEEAMDVLSTVRALGCDASAHSIARRVSAAAAYDMRTELRSCGERMQPATCDCELDPADE